MIANIKSLISRLGLNIVGMTSTTFTNIGTRSTSSLHLPLIP